MSEALPLRTDTPPTPPQSDGHQRHGHGHAHGDEVRCIDTGHAALALEIFEDGVPPRWRLRAETGHGWAPQDVAGIES